jgi:hypothetical protein
MEEGGGLKFSFYFNWGVEGVASLLELGMAVQIDPIMPKLMPPRTKRL